MKLVSTKSMVIYKVLVINWGSFQIDFNLGVWGKRIVSIVRDRGLSSEHGAPLALICILMRKILQCIILKSILSLVQAIPHSLNLVREVIDRNCLILNLINVLKMQIKLFLLLGIIKNKVSHDKFDVVDKFVGAHFKPFTGAEVSLDVFIWDSSTIFNDLLKFENLRVTKIKLSLILLSWVKRDLARVNLYLYKQSIGHQKLWVLRCHLGWVNPVIQNQLLLEQCDSQENHGYNVKVSDVSSAEGLGLSTGKQGEVTSYDKLSWSFCARVNVEEDEA